MSKSIIAGLLTAAMAAPTMAAQCDYQVDEEWATGFRATIEVTNPGTQTIDGWEVEIELPAGSAMMRNWDSEMTGFGLYAASNDDHNRTIAPRSTVSFAFTASNPRPGEPLDVLRLGGICGEEEPQLRFDAPAAPVMIAQPEAVTPAAQTTSALIADRAPAAAPSQAPTAFAVASVVRGAAPLTVQFDATASGDAEGNPVAHHWSFADGGTSDDAVVSRTYNTPGTYLVELIVDDGASMSEPVLLTITVDGEARPEALSLVPSAARTETSEAQVFDPTFSLAGAY